VVPVEFRERVTKALVSERLFQRLYIDFFGPFSKNEKKPVKKYTTQVVGTHLKEEIFGYYGTAEAIMARNSKVMHFLLFSLSLAKPTFASQPIRCNSLQYVLTSKSIYTKPMKRMSTPLTPDLSLDLLGTGRSNYKKLRP